MHSQGSLDDPRSKIQVMNAVLPYLAKLPRAVERSDYVFRFARKLRIDDQQMLAEVKRAAQQKKVALSETPLAMIGTMKFAEKRLLQVLLHNPSLQSRILSQCLAQDFDGLAAREVFAHILQDFRNNEVATFESLHRRFGGEPGQALLAQLQMEEVPEDLSLESAESFYSALRKLRLDSYKQEIRSKIDDASRSKDDELLNRLFEQLAQVDRELISLSRR